MQNTRLIQLLKTFSVHDIKRFRDFVNSPFYNKNKNVVSLFNVLKKFHPVFGIKLPEEEIIFKTVFPKEEYDYFKLKNIASDLLALGKEFLSVSMFNSNEHIKNKFLLEQFRDRNLDSMFLQLYKSYFEKLDTHPVRDEYYFSKQFDLAEELKCYYSPREPNFHQNLFQVQLDNFVSFSLIKLTRLYNTMLHENKQNNSLFDLKMFEETFQYIKNNKIENNPALLMFYYIVLLQKENNEKYFFKLKKLVNENFYRFSHFDIYMYFLHMAGFCAEMYNVKCRTDFAKEHFLLSKENFDRGTIEMGKIMYPDFMNHVKIAVRVEEYEWAEKYMNKFKDSLTEEYKNETLNFCYGYISYRKGNLEKALDLLSQSNFPNFILKVQVKILLLQIYYEKEFYEQAFAMIDTFKHYLHREKNLIEGYRKSFGEFARITNELIRIKSGQSSKETKYNLDRIKKDIEKINYNQFGIKLWLRQKAKEIKLK